MAVHDADTRTNARHVAKEISGEDAEAFIRKVGERVRSTRQSNRISRRELSEASGVSQRYLAQIESGEGNISISLLHRVSRALGAPITGLMSDDETTSTASQEISRLYHGATPEARREVLSILNGAQAHNDKFRRICLTGLRGAGKSTIGPRLAESLHMPFLELNAVIEEQAGMPVDEIIALYGQEGYRRLERQSLEIIVGDNTEIVLAAAGGIVSETDTYDYLLKHFYTIWLRAKPEEHMSRVLSQGDDRPMAGNPKAMDELKSILTSRENLYAQADAQVMTSGRSVDESLSETLDIVARFCVV